MKKIYAVLLLSLLCFPGTTSAKLKVVTTTTDLASLVSEVGGEYVEVKSLIRGSEDPHYIEPKPSYARIMNSADLFIQVGLSLEVGWVPPLLTQARNPKIVRGQPGYLEASQGLRLLEIPQGKVDRSQGDIHPEGNPHYWLDPRNGLIIAKNIADRLSRLDPENTSKYQANYQNFKSKLQTKIAEWQKQAAALRGKKIIVYHKGFTYFANFTGLNIAGYVETKAGIPPSPSHLLTLVQMIKKQKISVIVTESYYDPKPANKIAEQTGAKVLILPTSVEGKSGIAYIDLFDFLVRAMVESL
jgi:zinc/manganese transport system substrate-binding protein